MRVHDVAVGNVQLVEARSPALQPRAVIASEGDMVQTGAVFVEPVVRGSGACAGRTAAAVRDMGSGYPSLAVDTVPWPLRLPYDALVLVGSGRGRSMDLG